MFLERAPDQLPEPAFFAENLLDQAGRPYNGETSDDIFSVMQNQPFSPLPAAASSFDGSQSTNTIHTDKTHFIYKLAILRAKLYLAHNNRQIKASLTAVFDSLFRNGLQDFKDSYIEKVWTDRTYRVVHLNFSEIKDYSSAADFREKFDACLRVKFMSFGFTPVSDLPVIRQLAFWLQQQPASSLVFLIDEYDAPFIANDCVHDENTAAAVQLAISQFFTIIKSKDKCVRFAFVTSTGKLSSSSIFSGPNNFTDITLRQEYAALLDFAEAKMKAEAEIRDLC